MEILKIGISFIAALGIIISFFGDIKMLIGKSLSLYLGKDDKRIKVYIGDAKGIRGKEMVKDLSNMNKKNSYAKMLVGILDDRKKNFEKYVEESRERQNKNYEIIVENLELNASKKGITLIEEIESQIEEINGRSKEYERNKKQAKIAKEKVQILKEELKSYQ